MIKATISQWHEAIFRPYILHLLKRHFSCIHLLGPVPSFADHAILLLPNHSTWWDGFFVYFLKFSIFKRPGFLMMLEEQLTKNRFFSYVGAFSINPASAAATKRSLTYCRELLMRPEKPFVCIFPQGELLPWGIRPLGYKRGIDFLVRKMTVPVNVCQIAIKCEFCAGQRPDVFIRFGNNHVIEPGESIEIKALEEQHQQLLQVMDSQINNGEQGDVLLTGSKSVNELFEMLRRKIGLLREKK